MTYKYTNTNKDHLEARNGSQKPSKNKLNLNVPAHDQY